MSRLNAIRSWLTRPSRRRADNAVVERRVAKLTLEALEERLPPGDLLHLGQAAGTASSYFESNASSGPARTETLSLVQTTSSQPEKSTPPSGTSSASTETKLGELTLVPSSTGEEAFPSDEKKTTNLANLIGADDGTNQNKQSGGSGGTVAQLDNSKSNVEPRGAAKKNDDPVLPPETTNTNPVKITAVRDLHGRKTMNLLTHDGKPTIVGTAPAGRWVRFWDNGRPFGTVQVNQHGTFSFAVPKRLSDGVHNFRAGLAYAPMPSEIQWSIRVDTKAPQVNLSLTDFVRADEHASGFVNVGDNDGLGYINQVRLDFDINGDNRYTPDELNSLVFEAGEDFTMPDLTEGIYNVRARVYDAAGNVGTSSAKVQFDPNAGMIGSDVLAKLGGVAVGGKGESITPSETQLLKTSDLAGAYYVEGNSVMIEARYTTPAHKNDFLQALQSLGFAYSHSTPSSDLIAGYLPADQIKNLPNIPWFVSATPVPTPVFHTGTVDTQGDALIGAAAFRQQPPTGVGATGKGVVVGVLSDSVNQVPGPGQGIPASGNNLPSNLVVLQDGIFPNTPAGNFGAATDEGRAMLEVVHDISPSSALFFNTATGGVTNFAQGIRNLAANGARVIVDDARYLNQPMFSTGRIGEAVADVTKQGVTYVTAAGNRPTGDATDPTFDVGDFGFRATWNGIQASIPTTNQGTLTGTFMRFGNDALQTFSLAVASTIQIKFNWDSTYLEGGSNAPRYQVPNDLDVFMINVATGAVVGQSTAVNQQTDEANEQILGPGGTGAAPGQFPAGNYAFAIRLTSGPAPARIGWVSYRSSVQTIFAEGEGATTIFGQALSENAITVGAVDFSTPNQAEVYSSLGGGIDVFADDQGRRYPIPKIRMKPDVVGPDAVQTSFFRSPGTPAAPAIPQFRGTSAAAAHVAGAAALLQQQQPFATNRTIADHLRLTARDINASNPTARANPTRPTLNTSPGFDARTGYGLIFLTPIRSLPNKFTGSTQPQEPNNTSLQAIDLRLIGRLGWTQIGLSIRNNALGLPDFDWFCFTAANPGLLAVKIDSPFLALHLFVPVNGYLEEVPNGTLVAAGQKVFVEVKGRPIGPNAYTQDRYELFLRVI